MQSCEACTMQLHRSRHTHIHTVEVYGHAFTCRKNPVSEACRMHPTHVRGMHEQRQRYDSRPMSVRFGGCLAALAQPSNLRKTDQVNARITSAFGFEKRGAERCRHRLRPGAMLLSRSWSPSRHRGLDIAPSHTTCAMYPMKHATHTHTHTH